MVSGMVKITLYPLIAATIARPIPVFPLVGSIIVPPFLIKPSFSASSTIFKATLSLEDPAGLNFSIFAIILEFKLKLFSKLCNSTRGVFPINSNKLL